MNTDIQTGNHDQLVALLIRDFESRRLPYALCLDEQTGAGEELDPSDALFLDSLVGDIDRTAALVGGHSDLARLRTCAARICDEIRTRSARHARPSV